MAADVFTAEQVQQQRNDAAARFAMAQETAGQRRARELAAENRRAAERARDEAARRDRQRRANEAAAPVPAGGA